MYGACGSIQKSALADEMVEQLERVIADLPDSCTVSRCGVHRTKESPGSHRLLLSVAR